MQLKFQIIALLLSLSLTFRHIISFPPPDLSLQTREEGQYLSLHKCVDIGETFGGAFLVTREHLIQHPLSLNLSNVNCEAGSTNIADHGVDPTATIGLIIQSMDVLDYSVIHLSAYERAQRKWTKTVTTTEADEENHVREVLQKLIARIKDRTQTLLALDYNYSNYFRRTVVIMPFLGFDVGYGNSKPTNRFLYLHACFWSIYAHTSNIVIYVMNIKDYAYAKHTSKLPFYDVVLLANLPKMTALPYATVLDAKARLLRKVWDFDYVYYTESDQVLLLRIDDDIFTHLNKYPRRVITPHRLTPFPEYILTSFNKTWDRSLKPFDWKRMQCCMPRQNCLEPRGKDYRRKWKGLASPEVRVVNIFGLLVALGNSNFRKLIYRPCTLNVVGDWPYCP